MDSVCISFPNSGKIPSGGQIVSNFTHRLPFRVQEQLEKITRRKSVQKNQKISTSESTKRNDFFNKIYKAKVNPNHFVSSLFFRILQSQIALV